MNQIVPYLWVAAAVIFALVEINTVQFVSIWFVISAGITAISSVTFLSGNILLQLVLFLAVSAVCLIATRPLVKKIKKKDIEKTNSDKYIGRTGKVISDIGHNTYTGQVEVDGSKWTAVTSDNSVIKAGTTIEVVEIQGVKLIVKPVE